MNATHVPHLVPTPRVQCSGCGHRILLLLLLCASLMCADRLRAAELIQNGNFTDGLNGWKVPAALGSWNPLSPTNWVSLYPSEIYSYAGVVLYQNLNVTGVSGASLSFSVNVNQTWSGSGRTLSFGVDYATADGEIRRQVFLNPVDASIPTGVATNLTASFNLPPEAAKLVRLVVLKNDYGSFQAGNFSLIASGPSPGPVPSITGVTPTTGPYYSTADPVTITINGANFGATAREVWVGATPVDYVGFASPGMQAQVVSWNDTQIVARVVEPCASGPVSLRVGNVENNGSPTFGLTSPNFTLATRTPSIKVVRGQTATVVLGVECWNGFTTPSGISVQLNGLSGTPFNQPIWQSGGCSFDIPTAGLPNGIYQAVIQSAEAHSTPRRLPFNLQVVSVTNIDFFGVAELVNTNQGRVSPYSSIWQLWQSDGTLYQSQQAGMSSVSEPISVSSTDPGVVNALITEWGSYDFYAFSNGVAQLVFFTPDGLTNRLQVTVNAPDSPRILWSQITSGIADNSGTQTNFASWEYDGYAPMKQINVSGNINNDASWGNPVSISLSPEAGTDPGYYEIALQLRNSWSGPALAEAAVQLKVVNVASRGQISGSRYVVSGTASGQMMDGTLEVYDLNGHLVGRKELWDPMLGDYAMSYLPPGSYKVRFVPNSYFAPMWYPNALSAARATPVQVQAGQTTAHINFYLMLTADRLMPAPAISGDTLSFCVPTRYGVNYCLEASDDLNSNVWHTAQTAVGNGGTMTLTDSPGAARQRFYRLRMH